MNIVQRVQDILLRPKTTWPVIAAEPTDVKSLYTGYIMILAAIPPIAGFIGFAFVGIAGFRSPIGGALVNMIIGYVLSLVIIYLLALIVNALAPTFGGSKSEVNALKLMAYSYTAAWVAGIFSIIPALAIISVLAGLYGLYLLYLGVPVLMKCPAEKAAVYTIAIVVCAIVLSLVVGLVMGLLTPSPVVRPASIDSSTFYAMAENFGSAVRR